MTKLDRLIIHDSEDGDHEYSVANGYVARCVSRVHDENHPDARRLAAILNEFFVRDPKGLDRIDALVGY